MKKLFTSFLIASVLWGSVIVPARAFLPLAAIAYLTGATSGLNGALVGSILLHAAIAAIVITSDGNEPAANGSNTAIQIQLDPYTPLITPESAKPPSTMPATATEQIVSSTETHSVYHCPTDLHESQSSCIASLNAAFCCSVQYQSIISETSSNYTAKWLRSDDGGTGNSTFSKSTVAGCPSGSTWNGSSCISTAYTCPSGYTLNSSDNICYVNNPDETQVADAKTQIQRILDNFQKNPNDVDSLPENVSLASKDVVIQTPERTTKVHINDDSTVTVTEISVTSDGNTNVDSVKISAPGVGQAPEVIGKTNNKYSGQQLGSGGTSSGINSPQIPTTDGTGAGTPSSPAAGTNVLNLPANLAKTEDVNEVRDKLTTTNEKLDQVKETVTYAIHVEASPGKASAQNKLDGLSSDIDEGWVQKTQQLTDITAAGEPFTWDWSPIIPSSGCNVLSYGVPGNMHSIDPCLMITRVRDIAGYALYIFTAFALFSIATRKPE